MFPQSKVAPYIGKHGATVPSVRIMTLFGIVVPGSRSLNLKNPLSFDSTMRGCLRTGPSRTTRGRAVLGNFLIATGQRAAANLAQEFILSRVTRKAKLKK